MPAGANEYVYDEAGHILGEYDGNGEALTETVWLGDLPVAVLKGSGTSAARHYVNPDNLGAPHIIADSNATPVWIWDHLAFGNNAPNENPSNLGTFTYNLRFPGQTYDAESGLNYNMFRDYSPMIGRYIESDPIGLAAGVNTYGYVGGNPVAFIDPFGLYQCVAGASCNFTPLLDNAMTCFDQCTGRDTVITSGRDSHGSRTSHMKGQACDVGGNSNPDLTRADAERCFKKCFSGGSYGQQEQNGGGNGTHLHMQTNEDTPSQRPPYFAPLIKPHTHH